MGGASGKVAQILKGEKDKKLLEETFKSLDTDKNGTLSKDELAKLVTLIFDQLAKLESLALVIIPGGTADNKLNYDYRFLHWNSKECISASERDVISKHVADLLLLVADTDKSGTISFKEFHSFDWRKFIDGVNAALQQRAEMKVAEFEAKIPTLKTFTTPRDHVDGDYYLYTTKSFGQEGEPLYWNNDIENKEVESIDDPRLKPLAAKMLWPVRFSHYRRGDPNTWELYITVTVKDNQKSYTQEFHGDWGSLSRFQCQNQNWDLAWTPVVRFGKDMTCVVYFDKSNPKNVSNRLVPLVIAGKLYAAPKP